MEKLLKRLILLLVTTITLMSTSCGEDDVEEPKEPDKEDAISIPMAHQWIYDRLFNSTWKLSSTNNNCNSSYYNKWKDVIFTFSSEKYDNTNETYRKLYISGISDYGYWYINDNGNLTCIDYANLGGGGGLSAYEAAQFTIVYGTMIDVEIEFNNSDTFIITDTKGIWWKYAKVTNSSGSSNHHYPCKSCGESGDCWNCFGSGKDPITNKTCNTCHGSGKCQICNGKGYIII